MSRVGNQPIALPKGVKVSVHGQQVVVEGPKGKLERSVQPCILVSFNDESKKILLTRNNEEKVTRAFHGMERALINNMVKGVSEGFEKILEARGVGYKMDVQGSVVELNVGYSHPVKFELPQGIQASLLKEGREFAVKLEGIEKQLVGQVAARIRAVRPPEPYKGKGIRYRGEEIKLKAGKTGKK